MTRGKHRVHDQERPRSSKEGTADGADEKLNSDQDELPRKARDPNRPGPDNENSMTQQPNENPLKSSELPQLFHDNEVNHTQRKVKNVGVQYQPHPNNEDDFRLSQMTNPSQYTPVPPGLKPLVDLHALNIKQAMEMFEIFFGVETKNRYTIHGDHGKKIYIAAESTGFLNRCCMGKDRPFTIKILDPKGKLVMKIHRSYSCALCWWGGRVAGSSVTVTGPSDDEVYGKIVQVCSLCTPSFKVFNSAHERVMRIRGPCFATYCKCCMRCKVPFDIYLTKDHHSEHVGMIARKFALKSLAGDADNFGLKFPKDLEPIEKALLLAASFNLDFAFFEIHNTKGCCASASKCICCLILTGLVIAIGITITVLIFVYAV